MLKEGWVIFTCVSGHTFAINPKSIKENLADPDEIEEDARCPVCLRANITTPRQSLGCSDVFLNSNMFQHTSGYTMPTVTERSWECAS
jgi:hypothetical protein